MSGAKSAQVVGDMNATTAKLTSIRTYADKINEDNAASISPEDPYAPLVPKKISLGLHDLNPLISTSLEHAGGMQEVPAGPEGETIYEAFRDYVKAYRDLLEILTARVTEFSTFPIVGSHIANPLRSQDSMNVALWLTIKGKVPSKSTDFENQGESLRDTMEEAIEAHSGELYS
ncbi:uncharacterized protein F5Z01DRAFT_635051 [Emericellopsis atlantica]|uniref:Uncharacterized protein n=1 Tax=Emericellopsis atlantica TaxID=2614577 RepID=A0A9P7ZPU1_9HYPO|nr:uncharacterized protein F5Z01DRAFT_635051 [Emericellopsis atlantica]KAG9256099.1 hypothetical protein F5Z01DRAFT_635051 [Emericellopsis atlantica]